GEPQHWMPGSNGFVRTEPFGGEIESEAEARAVQITIVYHQDGTIRGYRNGVAYGRPIRKSPLQVFASGEAEILFGLRHKPPGGNRHLTAMIHRAAFYDRALTPEEVAASSASAPGQVLDDQID